MGLRGYFHNLKTLKLTLERKAAMSTSFGLKKETLAQVQARAEKNGISKWMLSLALTILNTRQWFRMDMAPKGSAENLKQYGSNDRANLWTIMRFIKEFVADHENFERWGDGTTRPDFTQKGLDSIYQYGFSTGMVGHVVKMLIAEGFLKNVKKGLLVGENQLLYTILPTALTSTSWEKPDNRGSRIGLASSPSICQCELTATEILEGKDTGVENLPELPEGTSVLYNLCGLVINLKLDSTETGCLMEADWDQISWEAIFPGVTLVEEPEAPKPRVVHPAPPVAKKVTVVAAVPAPAEAPKAETATAVVEVPGPLPAIPEWATAEQKIALNRLLSTAEGGRSMDLMLQAETALFTAKAKADFLLEEANRRAEEARLAKLEEEVAASALKNAQLELQKTAPARAEAHAKLLRALETLTAAHKATLAANEALGIEIEETSADLA